MACTKYLCIVFIREKIEKSEILKKKLKILEKGPFWKKNWRKSIFDKFNSAVEYRKHRKTPTSEKVELNMERSAYWPFLDQLRPLSPPDYVDSHLEFRTQQGMPSNFFEHFFQFFTNFSRFFRIFEKKNGKKNGKKWKKKIGKSLNHF